MIQEMEPVHLQDIRSSRAMVQRHTQLEKRVVVLFVDDAAVGDKMAQAALAAYKALDIGSWMAWLGGLLMLELQLVDMRILIVFGLVVRLVLAR
jgi:hypothetical protein